MTRIPTIPGQDGAGRSADARFEVSADCATSPRRRSAPAHGNAVKTTRPHQTSALIVRDGGAAIGDGYEPEVDVGNHECRILHPAIVAWDLGCPCDLDLWRGISTFPALDGRGMILPILHPADEPTPGLRYLLASELCIDPDPEITAILVEPVP